MVLDQATKLSIVKDVLKRPLEGLMPVQDLGYFVEASDYDVNISLEKEVEDHLSKEVYDHMLSRADSDDIREKILRDFEDFDDEELENELDFKKLTISSLKDIPIEEIKLSGLEGELYQRTELSFKEDRSSKYVSEVYQENQLDASNAQNDTMLTDQDMNISITQSEISEPSDIQNKRSMELQTESVPKRPKPSFSLDEVSFLVEKPSSHMLVYDKHLGKDVISVQYLAHAELYFLKTKGDGSLTSVDNQTLKNITIECKEWISLFYTAMDTLAHGKSDGNEIAFKKNIEKGVLLCKMCYSIMSSKKFTLEITREEVVSSMITFATKLLKSLVEKLAVNDKVENEDLLDIITWTNELLGQCMEISECVVLSESNISSIIPALLFGLSFKSEGKYKIPIKSLIVNCSSFLVSVYENYPVERKFILNEVTTRMKFVRNPKEKLITTRNGKQIHVFSHIIFSLLEFVQLKDSKSNYVQLVASKITPDEQVFTQKLLTEFEKTRESITFVLNTLHQFYLEGDRIGFDILMEDLNTSILSLDYCSIITIIEILVPFLVSQLAKDPLPPQPAETGLVGICGILCSTIFQLKGKFDSNIIIEPMMPVDDLNRLLNHLKIIQMFSSQNGGTRILSHSTTHLLLQYMDIFSNLSGKDEQSLDALLSESNEKTNAKALNTAVHGILTDLLQPKMSESVNETIAQKSYYELLVSRVGDKTNLLMHVIMQSLDSKRVKTKSKAVKLISSISKVFPQFLSLTSTQSILPKLLNDESPMVRDSILELLGNYININPEKSEKLFQPIADCIDDPSIQVRKKTIDIVNRLYVNIEWDSKAFMLAKLLRRLEEEEEDSVVNLITASLKRYFFPLQTSNDDEWIRMMSDLAENKQIPRSSEYLELFLTKNPTLSQNIQSSMDILVKKVLSLNEDDEPEMIGRGFDIISIFVKIKGDSFPSYHLKSLLPLLKNGNSDYRQQIFSIMKYSLPHVKSGISDEFYNKALQIVVDAIGKSKVSTVEDVIECAVALCQSNGDFTKLQIIGINISSKIVTTSANEIGKTIKLLYLISYLICHVDFEPVRDSFVPYGLRNEESITSFIARLVLSFLKPGNSLHVRLAAINSMLIICTKNPRFLSPNSTPWLDDAFIKGEKEIKFSIVQGLYKILKNVDKNKPKEHSAGFNEHSQGSSDDNFITAVVQKYLSEIFSLTKTDEGQFGVQLVQFIELALELGIVHPKTCVGEVFALISSHNPKIRKIALKLSNFLFSRYQSIVDTSYLEAFKLAVIYRKSLSKDMLHETYYLQFAYSIVEKTLTSRKKFINALTKMFVLNTTKNFKPDQAFSERDGVLFAIFNIQGIPFQSIEEILILIFHIDKLLQRKALDVYEQIDEEYESLKGNKKQALCLNCNIIIAMMNCKRFLISRYNISEDSIVNFKPTSSTIEYRVSPKINNDVRMQFNFNDLLKDQDDLPIINRILANSLVQMQELKS
ncbi:hypothetical protein CLIB1444_01S01398 [[Candida] jaroonii]|uniref:Uncharacterized protein n=1 Tax=[Candida] jaroonii TaxID=467808 RepID=A0ACA9XZX9_9ASCO|nr:hypothetical protein CLIB1444_01S01398 [[Candida] jaroonii]